MSEQDSQGEQESQGEEEPPRPPVLRQSLRVGQVTIDLSDERSTSREDPPVDLLYWGRTAGRAVLAEGVEGEAEVGVSFLDEEDMSELAGRHLGAPGSTDVLAFPLDFAEISPADRQTAAESGPPVLPVSPAAFGQPASPVQPVQPAAPIQPASPASKGTLPPALIGDVVICPAVAARQAAAGGRSLTEEMTLLVVHGVLHLLGYDHAAASEAALMKKRTEALLQELNP